MACERSYRKSTMDAYSVAAQTVATGSNISFDTFTGTGCAIQAFGSTGIKIRKPGLYLVNVAVTGVESGTTGNITVQLNNNGVAVPGATASAISGASTTITSLAFSKVVEVLDSCACINNTATLTLANTGTGATYSNVEMNVVKLA